MRARNTRPVLPSDHDAGATEQGKVAAPAPARRSTKAPTRHRQLHPGHFAFMRAVVQGLDTRDSWQRYLRVEGEHDDMRNMTRTIAWIRDEFAAAAKRYNRHGIARLVQIDATRIVDNGSALPTLEMFAADHGLLDFSQAEQLEQYQTQYGRASQRQSRRGRLITKQLDALRWLEGLAARPPLCSDTLASWLHPDLARCLEQAGVITVRQLLDRINGMGHTWWRGIRAIGVAKAARIADWLRTHEATLGAAIGAHVKVKRAALDAHDLTRIVSPATAIVPIDKFIVPAALDGSCGLYRAPQQVCRIKAGNDYEALVTWVKSKHGLSDEQRLAMKRRRGIDPTAPDGPTDWLHYLSHTQRAYVKEAERFLLWAILQQKKSLSSMTPADCQAYRDFLVNPTPVDLWCGPRGRQRWGPLWRPFEGPLSPSARRRALSILKSFYQFLVNQCYLTNNPWHGVAISNSARPPIDTARSFTQAQWEWVERQLDLLSDTSANRRLRFALHLLYATGLRLAEAVDAQARDLKRIAGVPAGYGGETSGEWVLTVHGKNDQERGVPVPAKVVGELSTYLESRGLDPDPEYERNQQAFLLGKATDVAERAPWSPSARDGVDAKAGISAATLHDQLKRFFTVCAQLLTPHDAKGAQRLAAASSHWLRHTHGSHSVAAGTPLDVVQQNMGHASLTTTIIYDASGERRRRR